MIVVMYVFFQAIVNALHSTLSRVSGILVGLRKDQNATRLSETELGSGERETIDRKSTRLNSSHTDIARMPSSA